MKVKYIGKERMDFLLQNNHIDLIPQKTYEVLHKHKDAGWYGIIDESGEEYAYPPEFFEIVEESIDKFK